MDLISYTLIRLILVESIDTREMTISKSIIS